MSEGYFRVDCKECDAQGYGPTFVEAQANLAKHGCKKPFEMFLKSTENAPRLPPELTSVALGLTEDKINHPSHYNRGRIEVIEFIEDQDIGFHLGNALKYICRAGHKDPNKQHEDLEKAIWYVRRHIEMYKPEETRRRPNEMPQERA